MKARSPLLGYNHNIRYAGRLYHVQTEDSGLHNPHVFTHLFFGGTILASKRVDYDPESTDQIVQKLMQTQHKAMLKELRAGAFDAKLEAHFGEPVVRDAPAPSVALDSGDTRPSAPPEDSMPIELGTDPGNPPPVRAPSTPPPPMVAEGEPAALPPPPAVEKKRITGDIPISRERLITPPPGSVTASAVPAEPPPRPSVSRQVAPPPERAPGPPTRERLTTPPPARSTPESIPVERSIPIAAKSGPRDQTPRDTPSVARPGSTPPPRPASAPPPARPAPAPPPPRSPAVSSPYSSSPGARAAAPAPSPRTSTPGAAPSPRSSTPGAAPPPRPAPYSSTPGAPPRSSTPGASTPLRTSIAGAAPPPPRPAPYGSTPGAPRPMPMPGPRAPGTPGVPPQQPPSPMRPRVAPQQQGRMGGSPYGTKPTAEGVVVARPAVIVSDVVAGRAGAGAPRRPAPPPAPPPAPAPQSVSSTAPRDPQAENIFGEDLVSEKSLDEVILAYLAEDLPGK